MDPKIASVDPPFLMVELASSKMSLKFGVGSGSLALQMSSASRNSNDARSLTIACRQNCRLSLYEDLLLDLAMGTR